MNEEITALRSLLAEALAAWSDGPCLFWPEPCAHLPSCDWRRRASIALGRPDPGARDEVEHVGLLSLSGVPHR